MTKIVDLREPLLDGNVFLTKLTKDDPMLVEGAKLAVDKVFRDEMAQQQLMLLVIAKQKIQMLQKLVGLADQTLNALANDSYADELLDYDAAEKLSMLGNIIKNIVQLTASTDLVKNLSTALNEVDRSLSMVKNTQVFDKHTKTQLRWLLAELQQEALKKSAIDATFTESG